METLLMLLIALVLHELGHIFAILMLRIGKIQKIGICSKGFYCYWVPYRYNGKLPALVSLSGPAVNLLLSAVLYSTFPYFSYVNLLFGVLNLVLPGGDGWNTVKRLT